ncbi:iron uptake transporter deferrochelatase/peroxidase subunit [Kitasatospora sp. NPDC001175]|uniref:iron uptake transporter deferrochelatase/peroxidase subunit n=1 Tax=Kitasatospora sp. NPDC001175 TaxID=3157103 RepID=UPI003D022F9A
MTALDPSATEHRSPLARRAFLRGASAGAAVTAGALAGAFAAAAEPQSAGPSGRRIPFHGPHQAGITTPQQDAASFVSFNVIAPDRAGLSELLRTLTERIRLLTSGGPVPATDLASPPTDSAILGPVLPADGLTITVSVGASLFDDRYGLTARKPAKLVAMPVFPDDNMLGSKELHGDLSLQICADSRDTVMHALRDITRHTRGGMQPSWKADGFHAAPRPSGTPRNQLGFKDGISNPEIDDRTVADSVLWTHGGANGEPAWVEGGSYQVVRIIRMLVEFWDRVSLREQERMIGRRRDSGAPLDGTGESDAPDFQSDSQGLLTPMNSHIRLANPRTPDSAGQRFLRRGYNYDRGLDLDGNLDVGLIFCCYQQDVERQFQTVQQRLAGEPLVDYISPTGGGYFFTLPGAKGPSDWLGSTLLS